MNTLAHLSRTLSDIFSGSQSKSGKLFAMGLYEGIASYRGNAEDHRIGQIESASATIETYIEALLKANIDESSLSEVSRTIRTRIGDPKETRAEYSSDLFTLMQRRITRNKLYGNNFRDIGIDLTDMLDTIPKAKGDSHNAMLIREYETIRKYLGE